MRIIVIGDLQYQQGEEKSIRATMKRIAFLRPDLTVALGDYGSNRNAGSEAGVKDAHNMLLECGGQLRMLIGNHDIQNETGTGTGAIGSIELLVRRLCDLDSTHGVLEFADFRLLFLSCDLQPGDTCFCKQECSLTEKTFRSFTEILDTRPGVPAIVFSHAPILGCGLRTVPDVHVRATNAFLDQNHNPGRWVDWVRRHPQIKIWCSGHYHLSPESPGTLSQRYGVTFLGCGAPTSASRDGMRQSRVLDIGNHGSNGELVATASVLDHDRDTLIRTASIMIPLCIEDHRPVPPHPAPAPIPTGTPSVSCICINQLQTACGNPLANGLAYLNSRLYAATDIGYLWEVETRLGEAMGTWRAIGDNTDGLCISEHLLWWHDGKRLMVGDTENPRRFVRDSCDPKQVLYETFFTEPITRLLPAAGGAVFAHTHGAAWLCRLEGDVIRKEARNTICSPISYHKLRLQKGRLQVRVQKAQWVTLMAGAQISAYTVVAHDNGRITAWVVSPGPDRDLCFQQLQINFLH